MRISMIRKFIIVFLVLSPILGFGQDSAKSSSQDNSSKGYFAFSAGASYQKQFTGELGVTYFSDVEDGPCTPRIVMGPKVASEFNFRFNNQFTLGPKISYEADFTIIGARVNLIDYTNFKENDICFTPEIGLTLMGYVNLFYGYNIPLSSDKTNIPGTNRITLTINI